MVKAKAGDRVIIMNALSSFHEFVGDVVETCGPSSRFDVKVKFPEHHREIGFWWNELLVLPVDMHDFRP